MWRVHRLGLHVQIAEMLLGEHLPVDGLLLVGVGLGVRSLLHGAQVVADRVGRAVHCRDGRMVGGQMMRRTNGGPQDAADGEPEVH